MAFTAVLFVYSFTSLVVLFWFSLCLSSSSSGFLPFCTASIKLSPLHCLTNGHVGYQRACSVHGKSSSSHRRRPPPQKKHRQWSSVPVLNLVNALHFYKLKRLSTFDQTTQCRKILQWPNFLVFVLGMKAS